MTTPTPNPSSSGDAIRPPRTVTPMSMPALTVLNLNLLGKMALGAMGRLAPNYYLHVTVVPRSLASAATPVITMPP